MQLLLDNLLATVIAGMVMLMLFAVNHRGQQSTVSATTYYMLKKHQISFAETVERDMKNVTQVVTALPNSFTFQARRDSVTIETVTYQFVPAGVGGERQFYQIQRLVNGNLSGGSSSTILDWKVELRDASGNAVLLPGEARQIYFRFESLLDLKPGVNKGEQAMHDPAQMGFWEASFRPPMLQDSVLFQPPALPRL